MQKFTVSTGVAVGFDASNIDTDQIIPKQFLLAVDRKGFGKHLFHGLRYLDEAETQLNPDFILNQPINAGAQFLVARENFGNGSSREHAPWALLDYGFKAIIASSFADIFSNNSLGNGLLLVKLSETEIDEIMTILKARSGTQMTVSLEDMTVKIEDRTYTFNLDPFRRKCILEGLDAVGLTLQHDDRIKAFEAKRAQWMAGE